MKKIIISVLVFMLVSAYVFLLFCFGNWELNPGKWDVATRSAAAFFSPLFGVVAGGGVYALINEK